ncbi:hypothetical protein Tco_1193414 [Tanacetum coccineum]
MVPSLVVKKQTEVSRENVSNSNPFDALNSVEHHDDLDDDDNSLVPTSNMESDKEVKVVFDEIDDDYDPYDEDLYESHDMSDHLQVICDDLDIMVRGRKKK